MKYNLGLVEAVNDYNIGWNVVRAYLGHYEDDRAELDEQMDKLFTQYNQWLDNGGYNEEGNLFDRFILLLSKSSPP